MDPLALFFHMNPHIMYTKECVNYSVISYIVAEDNTELKNSMIKRDKMMGKLHNEKKYRIKGKTYLGSEIKTCVKCHL